MRLGCLFTSYLALPMKLGHFLSSWQFSLVCIISYYLLICTLFLLRTNILSLCHTVTSGARDSLQICIENAIRSSSPDSSEEGQCAGRRYSLLLTSYIDVRVHYLSGGNTKLLEMAILGQPHGVGAAGYGVEPVLVVKVFRVFM